MDPLDLVLDRLRTAGKHVKRSGHGYSCQCPGHNDRHSSLSVTGGQGGAALLYCHAGCSIEEVLEGLGLEKSDLFPKTSDGPFRASQDPAGSCSSPRERGSRERPKSKARTFVTVNDAEAWLAKKNQRHADHRYDYLSADGELVQRILRWDIDGKKNILPVSRSDEGWAIRGLKTPCPLYRLPEFRAEEPIYVFEGEKAADAAAAIGLNATTSCGGAKRARKSDWSICRGRDVIVVPDHDEPGDDYADDVCELAQAAGASSTRIIRLAERFGDLREHDDIVDALEVHEDAEVRAAIDDLARAAAEVEIVADTDEPEAGAARAYEKFEPFPTQLLPDPFRSFVSAGAAAIGCDESMIALPLLSSAAGAVGNSRQLHLKHSWSEPPIVWTIIVAESGAQKSPAFDLVLSPIRRFEQTLVQEFKEEHERYLVEAQKHAVKYKAWEAEAKKAAKNGDEDLPDPPESPEQPIRRRVMSSDPTIEALTKMLHGNPRGLLVARDELSGWFGGFDLYTGAAGSDVAKYLEMFGGRPLLIDRKTSGSDYIERATVSITGGIQPGVLRRALASSEHRENGLLPRFLIAKPPRYTKQWSEDDVDLDLKRRVQDAFDHLFALEGADPQSPSAPVALKLDDEAKSLWIETYNTHNQGLDARSGHYAAAWSKLEAYAARLALVIHLMKAAAREPGVSGVGLISQETLSAAIRLRDWFVRETERVYRWLDATEHEARLTEFVEWINARGGAISVRDLQQTRRKEFPRAKDAEAALNELVDGGFGEWERPAPGPQGGRPSKIFRVLSDEASQEHKTSHDETLGKGFVNGHGEEARSNDESTGDAA